MCGGMRSIHMYHNAFKIRLYMDEDACSRGMNSSYENLDVSNLECHKPHTKYVSLR